MQLHEDLSVQDTDLDTGILVTVYTAQGDVDSAVGDLVQFRSVDAVGLFHILCYIRSTDDGAVGIDEGSNPDSVAIGNQLIIAGFILPDGVAAGALTGLWIDVHTDAGLATGLLGDLHPSTLTTCPEGNLDNGSDRDVLLGDVLIHLNGEGQV